MGAKKILEAILFIILYIVTITLSVYNAIGFSLALNIIASFIMLFYIKSICKSYTNIIVIFYFFSILYGLSGPISVFWGGGLPSIYGKNFNIGVFLIAYALSNIGLLMGVISCYLIYKSNKRFKYNDNLNNYYINNKKPIINIAIIFAQISLIFEGINFYRVGGFSTITKGKAAYQSAISELTLTLPSGEFVKIGFVLLSLYLGLCLYNKIKVSKYKLLIFFLTVFPFLALTVFLGKRGTLLSIIVIIIMGIFYFKPLKRIKIKLLIALCILYVIMCFLYANRGIASLAISNFDYFIEIAFDRQRLIDSLNPASNEFGAPFGNFNMFYISTNGNYNLLLGESYLKGLVLPIPSFLYPGEKPQQIGYIFRDMFFISEASRGSIAGTAFSSILEAYWNFSFTGVLIVYFFIGYVIGYLDNRFKYSSVISSIIYITISPLVITFHRTSMAAIYSSVVLQIVVILVILNPMLNIMGTKFISKEKLDGDIN